MNDVIAVGVVESAGDSASDSEGFLESQLSLAVHPVAERLPLDVGHNVKQEAAGIAGIEERKYVGVIEPRGEPDLAQKTIRAYS